MNTSPNDPTLTGGTDTGASASYGEGLRTNLNQAGGSLKQARPSRRPCRR